jgi:hypothetical protein
VLERKEKSTYTNPLPHIKNKKKVMCSCFYEAFIFHRSYLVFAILYRDKKLHHHEKFSDTSYIKRYLKNNTVVRNTHITKETSSIHNKMTLSLHTIPVELVYRILDHLDPEKIFWSCINVCTKLNAITDTYYRYQVIFAFIIKPHSHYFSSASFYL